MENKQEKRICNFCNNKAIYICDFIGKKPEKIAGCEEHKLLAIYKQKDMVIMANMSERPLLK